MFESCSTCFLSKQCILEPISESCATCSLSKLNVKPRNPLSVFLLHWSIDIPTTETFPIAKYLWNARVWDCLVFDWIYLLTLYLKPSKNKEPAHKGLFFNKQTRIASYVIECHNTNIPPDLIRVSHPSENTTVYFKWEIMNVGQRGVKKWNIRPNTDIF